MQDAVNTLEFIDDLPSEYDLGRSELESIIKGGNVQTSRIKEGVTRFTHGNTDIAIIKRGEGYRIYDYNSGKVSRTLTRSELSSIVRQLRNGGKTIEVIGRISENSEFGIRNSELGSAKKIQKLGKMVLDGDNSHLKFIANNDIINNSEQETDSNVIEKETEVYVTREETRDEFNRAAHEEGYTVGERGEIAYAYKVCRAHSENGQKLSQELKKLGIKGIIHEGLKSNCNGITITYDAGASTFAGVCVFIDNDIARDPIEAAGHEAFHYWSNSLQRSAFRGVIDDNVIVSAKEFVDFQNKISKDYFDEEISLDDGRWEMLYEEIHAYITGYVYSGDADNVVRPFLRDFDAVKNALDDFFEAQQSSGKKHVKNKNETRFDAISKADKKVSIEQKSLVEKRKGEKLPDVFALSGEVRTPRKSDGRIAEAKAQVYSDRVFTKKVVKDAFSKIRIMKTLSTKDINALSEEMWIALNKSKNAKQRETAARDVLSKTLNYAQNESRTKAALELGITPEMLVSEVVKEFKDLLNLGKATYKAKADAKIEEARAKATDKAETRATKAEAKADERASKAEKNAKERASKAEERADRAIETKSAQLKAEYTTDKVFSQNSVKSGFESVPEVKKLPTKVREDVARDLWLELEASDSQDVRDTFILKYSVKLYDAIKNADYEAYENMTMKEKDALREKLNAAIKSIVESGKKSKWAKQKDNVRGIVKLEEQVAGEIKSKIYQSLKKIEDVKKERFLAASAYKSDEFKDTLEQLTKIDWRGKFSVLAKFKKIAPIAKRILTERWVISI